MLTETERINFIINEEAKKGMNLLNFINKQIEEFESSAERKMMIEGDKYFKNKTAINKKERYYIDDNGRVKLNKLFSNYKLANAIPRKLVNQKVGLLLKKNITVKEVKDPNKENNNEYENLLKDIFDEKMHKMLKYTVTESINKGKSWWFVYIDEEGELKIKRVNAEKVIPLWKDDEHEKLDAVIMVYKLVSYVNDNKEIIKKVEYWDKEGVRYLVYDNNKLIDDVEKVEEVKDTVIRYDDKNSVTLCGHFLLNNTPMTWSKIPFVYWKYNFDEKSLVYYLKSLVNCYDELMSIMADIIKDTPHGVNVVRNYGEDVKKFNKNLNELNTIFLDKDGEYKRENVTIDINCFKTFIEILRRSIYETGAGVDTQSEKFGTAQSGVALEELFADLDLDCSNIETECQSSLKYFLFFVNTFMEMTNGDDYSDRKVEFVFNKSMITNESEKIADVNNSQDVSKKTRLAHHPWITDIDSELDQIKKEEEDALGPYMNKKKDKKFPEDQK